MEGRRSRTRYAVLVVRLRVAEELRLFLPLRSRRSGEVDVEYDGSATLGHLVQAAGIPLTEVTPALRRAERPCPDDVVDVLPRERPQALDGPPRLLLDVHLGALARRLRLLGVDTDYSNDAADAALVARAGAQDRLLLSKDRGLLMRRALRRAAYVRGDAADAQLADVLDRFPLPLAPYTLCPACGEALREVAKANVLERIEPGTRRTQQEFRECVGCGRVYWRGAHQRRLEDLVRRARPAELTPPSAADDR
jgi:uncharacterized protein with PIN domain